MKRLLKQINGQRGRCHLEMIGKTFFRWTVLSYDEKTSKEKGLDCYLCRCSCSAKTEKIVTGISLRMNHNGSNGSKSCGCWNRECVIARNKDPYMYRDVWRGRTTNWKLTEDEKLFAEKYSYLPAKILKVSETKDSDELSIARLALINAVHNWFNRSANISCSWLAFATDRIQKAIIHKTSHKKLLKMPVEKSRLRYYILNIQRLALTTLGQKIPDECLAKLLDIDVNDIREVNRINNPIYSLDEYQTIQDYDNGNTDSETFAAFIPDKTFLSPLDNVILIEEIPILKVIRENTIKEHNKEEILSLTKKERAELEVACSI